jgi:hypothetical protein
MERAQQQQQIYQVTAICAGPVLAQVSSVRPILSSAACCCSCLALHDLPAPDDRTAGKEERERDDERGKGGFQWR